jgi:hypothetical protein
VDVIHQLVQTFYWAGLSTWFGAALFLMLATPIILRVLREEDPTLPRVLSVNLDSQHATLLALNLIGHLMQALTRVGLICAGAVLLGLISQALATTGSGAQVIRLIARTMLFLVGTGIALFEWLSLSRRVNHVRDQYIEYADDTDRAMKHRAVFERLHRQRMNLLFVLAASLLGLIFFSSSTGVIRLALD